MLEADMVERHRGIITVVDINTLTLKKLIEYIYSGKLNNCSQEMSQELYKAADKYSIDQLKISCREIMLDHMTSENACEYLVLADTHSDQEFKIIVIHYILKVGIPLKDDIWPEFCEKYTKLANDALNTAYRTKYTAVE